MTVHFVMMGVCGCGKTTAALALQRFLNGCPYAEGDEFHTQENRDKMGAGIPLTDEDRYPWLYRLRDWMTERSREGVAYSVVTCSALKRSYRDILRGAEGKVVFVHLTPPQVSATGSLHVWCWRRRQVRSVAAISTIRASGWSAACWIWMCRRR